MITFFSRWCFLLLVSATLLGAEKLPNIVYCLADDWSWPHAGVYGDKTVHTPNFDRLAREGVLFTHAFCAAPSCSPSRAAMLTGQYPHRLEAGGNLWGFLPRKFVTYPDLLKEKGYFVGLQGKGWGPGSIDAAGRSENPAGRNYRNFQQFLQAAPKDKPFCFWFGSKDPHRPYAKGSGAQAGLKRESVQVPPYLPDTAEVREDLLDYYFAVERFDRDVGAILALLEQSGQLENTIIVISGDNGLPFPRCKTNLYDSGSRVPLAIRWPGHMKAGLRSDVLVNLADLAPTFLEAAGIPRPDFMTARSLGPALLGSTDARGEVFLERERHANVRAGDVGYPARAIRTTEFLYIRNFHPDRWPGGDPVMWKAVGEYGDCDNGPAKSVVLAQKGEPFRLAFEKRPAEELYDLAADPHQLRNVAGETKYVEARKKLSARLEEWMRQTEDPRLGKTPDVFDTYPYFGDARRMPN